MPEHALLDDDPYRLQCPRGHTTWEPVNGSFWCPRCEQIDAYPGDGAFAELVDAATGERLDRVDVRELEEEVREDGVRVGGD